MLSLTAADPRVVPLLGGAAGADEASVVLLLGSAQDQQYNFIE